jgi:riboflavin synthase
MFTGLIQHVGVVKQLERKGEQGRLILQRPEGLGQVAVGDSVALNGCCLTVVNDTVGEIEEFHFDLLNQTLEVTNLGRLSSGSRVNMELAMGVGDRFGGHMVQGHVDGVVKVLGLDRKGQDHRLEVSLAEAHRGWVVEKGSITLDGISLTVAEVLKESVVCWIIPHTFQKTQLWERKVGDGMNVEYELLAKYVAQHMARLEMMKNNG